MYKSQLFTFGFLLSSLVMLVLVPFLNQQQNSFSNVMAQEYDKYEDSSYSTYPTDDKKYECRTGPFEGFFVSSVEFCKFKFDDKDRNDNRTGTQGPAGPAGPAGPQGIQGIQGPIGPNGTQGPAGPNQIPPTKIYINPGPFVVTSPVNSSAGFASTTATCNPGDTAISGQHTMQPLVQNFFPGTDVPPESFSGSYMSAFDSFSNPPTNNAWTFKVYGNNIGITPFVTCFDN